MCPWAGRALPLLCPSSTTSQPRLVHMVVGGKSTENKSSWAWWYMLTILALERLRQEDHEFEASLGYSSEFEARLGYIIGVCLKKRVPVNMQRLGRPWTQKCCFCGILLWQDTGQPRFKAWRICLDGSTTKNCGHFCCLSTTVTDSLDVKNF
jgi:hypothetical protein